MTVSARREPSPPPPTPHHDSWFYGFPRLRLKLSGESVVTGGETAWLRKKGQRVNQTVNGVNQSVAKWTYFQFKTVLSLTALALLHHPPISAGHNFDQKMVLTLAGVVLHHCQIL